MEIHREWDPPVTNGFRSQNGQYERNLLTNSRGAADPRHYVTPMLWIPALNVYSLRTDTNRYNINDNWPCCNGTRLCWAAVHSDKNFVAVW